MCRERKRALFVTGTDTGVGKTFVTSRLAAALRQRFRVGVMKPAESGCTRAADGRLLPQDALALRAAAGCDLPIECICPYALPRPLAPAEAARQAGVAIGIERIKANYSRIADASEIVLVEGAGGLLVPLSGTYLFADLIQDLGLPLLVVARAGLGTVNHSLLTLEVARARGIAVVAVVLNEHAPAPDDASLETNRRLLGELTSVPVLGPIPHLTSGTGLSTGVGDTMDQIAKLLF